MKYWWVNHKQTSKFEISGGFLWSPVFKKDGNRNRFYDNMRVASPGDFVISYSDQQIRYVGVVEEFAMASPIPPGFDKKSKSWSRDRGWMLPVKWFKLSVAIRPKHKTLEIGGLLPTQFSPIDPVTGNGRQHVYLAEIGKELFQALVQVDFNASLESEPCSGIGDALELIDDAIVRQMLSDPGLDSTVKIEVVASRRGQGLFKKRIYDFEDACRLTRIKTPSLLIASHIKPWRLCENSHERLDGANGLLMAPHVDLLFDRGLISFANEGKVIVSPRIQASDLKLLGLDSVWSGESYDFDSRQVSYLDFHRKNIFLY